MRTTPAGQLALVAAILVCGAAEGAAAQAGLSGALPRELTAALDFDHMHRDMMTVTTSRYDVTARLRIARDGRAELSLVGNASFRRAEIPTSGPGTPATEWELSIDHAWTGEARRDGRDVVIRFTHTTAYQPGIDTDVEWRCAPASIAVDRGTLAAWRCATPQSRTRSSGAGHSLPSYMQVPIVLARPRMRLHAEVMARGGANHRSETSSATYSRGARR